MTDTQAPPYRRNLALFNASMVRNIKPTVFSKDNGNLVVQGQPVFRSGQFRDSSGTQHTWEALHMDQMVAHFNILRGRGLFENVPVRDGHPGFLIHGTPGTGQVVGWHTGLTAQVLDTHNGGQETFLMADYEFTDPEAIAKYNNGTYRNRSSEVGEYTTNDESTFWPTYMGFAWVDLAAVEGLNSTKHAAFNSAYSTSVQSGKLIIPVEKEFSPMPPENNIPGQAGTPAGQQQVPVPSFTPPPPVAFSVNGQSTVDVGAVQSHITSLELFQRETLESRRSDFVTALATSGKILATSIDGNIAFAKSLTPAQFESWKKTMDDAPASTVFAQHAAGTGTQGTPPNPGDEAQAARIMTLVGVVSMHKASGLPLDVIREKDSYKELIRLDPSAAI